MIMSSSFDQGYPFKMILSFNLKAGQSLKVGHCYFCCNVLPQLIYMISNPLKVYIREVHESSPDIDDFQFQS